MIDASIMPTNAVDQKMKQVDADNDIPAELRAAFYNMLKEGIKGRVAHDSDYKRNSGKYDHLDRV